LFPVPTTLAWFSDFWPWFLSQNIKGSNELGIKQMIIVGFDIPGLDLGLGLLV